MVCKNCKKEISDSVLFCPFCGCGISESENIPSSKSEKNDTVANMVNDASKGAQSVLEYTVKRSIWYYKIRLPIFLVLALISLIAGISMLASPVEDYRSSSVFNFVVFAICAVLILFTFIESKFFKIEIYNDKIKMYSGIFNRKEHNTLMTPILSVNLEQSLWGQIFNYGNIVIDRMGKGWDINTQYIKNPKKLKKYLETKITAVEKEKIGMHLFN